MKRIYSESTKKMLSFDIFFKAIESRFKSVTFFDIFTLKALKLINGSILRSEKKILLISKKNAID